MREFGTEVQMQIWQRHPEIKLSAKEIIELGKIRAGTVPLPGVTHYKVGFPEVIWVQPGVMGGEALKGLGEGFGGFLDWVGKSVGGAMQSFGDFLKSPMVLLLGLGGLALLIMGLKD